MPTQSVDPRTGEAFGPVFADSSADEVNEVVQASDAAAEAWGGWSPADRATALAAVADALDGCASGLVPLADRESGLGELRLTGELARTTFQLRMFARALEAGESFRGISDPSAAGPPPAGHPQMLRVLVPIGTVAVYGASNFPFAFSVPGGDTASALAAGCPVVVKAHPGHPQTSASVAQVMVSALRGAGAPPGTMGIVHGLQAGRLLVVHPLVRAAAFTGSYGGGRALFDLAVGRPDPIPFYGELGSVNPVVVTAAAAARGDGLVVEYLDSLTLGTGQFCTNPGLLLVPAGSGLTEMVAAQAARRPVGVLLHTGVAELLRANVARLTEVPGVRTMVDGSRAGGPGAHSGPVILAADASTALANPELVRTECFGPAGMVIEYGSTDELLDVLGLLEGCLVGTVHGEESEPLAKDVVRRLAKIAGRVVWNGWPTGVAVTAGQQHGGPHPATTSSLHTSVGSAAVLRFLRPVAFQSVPAALLP